MRLTNRAEMIYRRQVSNENRGGSSHFSIGLEVDYGVTVKVQSEWSQLLMRQEVTA